MSHGEHKPRHYGRRAGISSIPPEPEGPLPGSPEWRAALEAKGVELTEDIKAMYGSLQGNWAKQDWVERAERAGRQYVENMIRFYRANK